MESASDKRHGLMRKSRIVAAGLAFAVTAQMTVSLLVAAVPVIAPELAKASGLDVQLIAFFFPIAFTAAFFSNFAVPKLLPRFGGAGLSLACIFVGAGGLLLMLPTTAVLIVAAPLVLGFALGVVTPATSQVVGPLATSRTAGLFMSIRQSAVPAGSMLAGIIMPVLAVHWGWHAPIVLGLATAVLAIILLPTLPWLNDRSSTPPPAQRPWEPVKRLLAMSGMRQILFAVVAYMMLVICLRSFFTVYLVRDLGFDLTTAGLAFSAAQLAGIPGQIGCAIISDRWLSPRTVLAISGVVMTSAAVLAANFTHNWPTLAIVTVALILGLFSIGCVPVMLGEITRRSPVGQVGSLVSGGNLFIMAGCALGPLFFGAVGAVFGYAGGLEALAICTAVGTVVVAPLRFRRTPARAGTAGATSAIGSGPVHP
jgi:MFS family permease